MHLTSYILFFDYFLFCRLGAYDMHYCVKFFFYSSFLIVTKFSFPFCTFFLTVLFDKLFLTNTTFRVSTKFQPIYIFFVNFSFNYVLFILYSTIKHQNPLTILINWPKRARELESCSNHLSPSHTSSPLRPRSTNSKIPKPQNA